MGIKTVPQLPYCLDLAPCDFCLFPKLTGCCYETIEEMKEAVTKVIDTLTQEDFHSFLVDFQFITRLSYWNMGSFLVTVARVVKNSWFLVGTVQQMHCSRRRLLRKGLEFYVCTINKSAHTKKRLETFRMHLVCPGLTTKRQMLWFSKDQTL